MNQRISWKQLIMVIVLLSVMTACGGSSNKGESKTSNNDSGSNGSDGTISHNGTTYGTVKSPYTGKIWLDRHLGAARVCESLNDTACYGDYYQWGRNFDGHENSISGVTQIKSENINNVVHSKFILSTASSYDWVLSDANGKKRKENWSKIDGNSICPIGFRVATIEELKTELLSPSNANIRNGDDAFKSFLKLPSSGHRYRSSGDLLDKGLWGSIWSVSASGTRTSGVYFTQKKADSYNGGGRANGRSVRCIKD